MVDRRETWLLLPRPIRELPADLAAVIVLVGITLAMVFVPVVNETPLRVGFGLLLVLFLPGYAFIAALFPDAGEGSPTDSTDRDSIDRGSENERVPSPAPESDTAESRPPHQPSGTGTPEGVPDDRAAIDGVERVALSFGLSIAIVPLIGLLLNFTPWGIRLVPITVSLSGFTLLCTGIAANRRRDLPPERRFAVPYHEWIAAARRELLEPDERIDVAINVVLALSILLAIGSVGYAIAAPQQGEQFSELYLLTENDDGELVADGYPETLESGESAELIVGIGNNEHETTSYIVVVQLQAVEIEGNESTVTDRTEIDRFVATLEHGGTHHERHVLEPTMTGENLHVQYLLYIDDVPSTPTSENAYRDVHLWIDVE